MLCRSTWLVLLAAALAAVLGGWLQHRSQSAHAKSELRLQPGQPAPDLMMTDLDGHPHRLSDYRGRRLLLNFWASWCGPCRDEMPALSAAAKRSPDIAVVGGAMDEPARVRAFLAAYPVGYPILIGDMTAPSTSLRLFDRGEVLPYSVLLDANRRVLATRRGALDAATLAQWLSAPAAD